MFSLSLLIGAPTLTKAKKVLFPTYGVRELFLLYGPAWKALIEGLTTRWIAAPHTIALSLMCRRLAWQNDHSHACSNDGLCAACMVNILSTDFIDEKELLALYHATLNEILHTQDTIRTNRGVRHRQNGATYFSRDRQTKELSMFGIAETLFGVAVVIMLGLTGSIAIAGVLLWVIRHNREEV